MALFTQCRHGEETEPCSSFYLRHDEERDRTIVEPRGRRAPRRRAWPAGVVGAVPLAFLLVHLVLHLP
jgi:hypothetical protein